MALLNLKPQHRMREYKCKCGKLLMRYGSFNHEFPEYKELRIEKDAYTKDMKSQSIGYIANPGEPMKHVGYHVNIRCYSCGEFNKFTIITNPLDKKFKIAR